MKHTLLNVAKRVNWYTDAETLLRDEPRFLCQVMARGRAEDIAIVQQHYPESSFQYAYQRAPAGLFDNRSWAYWGLMLFNDSTLPQPTRFAQDDLDWRRYSDVQGTYSKRPER